MGGWLVGWLVDRVKVKVHQSQKARGLPISKASLRVQGKWVNIGGSSRHTPTPLRPNPLTSNNPFFSSFFLSLALCAHLRLGPALGEPKDARFARGGRDGSQRRVEGLDLALAQAPERGCAGHVHRLQRLRSIRHHTNHTHHFERPQACRVVFAASSPRVLAASPFAGVALRLSP
jgi:hypothetical protein